MIAKCVRVPKNTLKRDGCVDYWGMRLGPICMVVFSGGFAGSLIKVFQGKAYGNA